METPHLLMVHHLSRARDAGDRAEDTATDNTMLDGGLDTHLLRVPATHKTGCPVQGDKQCQTCN